MDSEPNCFELCVEQSRLRGQICDVLCWQLPCGSSSRCRSAARELRAKRVPVSHEFARLIHRYCAVDTNDVLVNCGQSVSENEIDELESWFEANPRAESVLVLAQQSLREARAVELRSWGRSIVRHRDAAAYALIAMEGPQEIALAAMEIHNAAVERFIALAQKGPMLAKSACANDWKETLNQLGISVFGTTRLLEPNKIACLTPACQYHVSGLSHHYGSGGLGVPLVALWPGERD